MKHIARARNRTFISSITCCCLLLAGCELGSEETSFVETKQQQVSSDGQEAPRKATEGEGPTKTAVTVDWDERIPSEATDHFVFKVTNNSSDTQSVHLVLSATSFSGEVVEQPLSDLVLSPNESRLTNVHVDDVPIQSSGHPGSLRVVAFYSERGHAEEVFRAFTAPLMLTFDPDFRTAQAATVDEQLERDARSSRASASNIELGHSRRRSEQSGSFAAVDAASKEVSLGPTGTVGDLPVSIDWETVRYFPNTEPHPEEH